MSDCFGMVVLFVREYDSCLDFYRRALGMQVLRSHEGGGHPPWALLQLGDFRMALHAGFEGSPLKGGSATPICVNFFVEDVHATIEAIERHGGALKRLDEDADFRPTQPVLAHFARFEDPAGNEHFLVQETKRFSE